MRVVLQDAGCALAECDRHESVDDPAPAGGSAAATAVRGTLAATGPARPAPAQSATGPSCPGPTADSRVGSSGPRSTAAEGRASSAALHTGAHRAGTRTRPGSGLAQQRARRVRPQPVRVTLETGTAARGRLQTSQAAGPRRTRGCTPSTAAGRRRAGRPAPPCSPARAPCRRTRPQMVSENQDLGGAAGFPHYKMRSISTSAQPPSTSSTESALM
jgi:hypothetical protein